jgi:hypothetical protein
MAVDTHVFRVGNRTGLAPGNTPLEIELGLEKVIPSEFMLHAHHWLILHGRYMFGPQAALRSVLDQRSLSVAGKDGMSDRTAATRLRHQRAAFKLL